MIYVTCKYNYLDKNKFSLVEICISDDKTMYVLARSNGFIPYLIKGISVPDLVAHCQKTFYPSGAYSKVRVVNDSDPKALANFIHSKIEALNTHTAAFDRAAYSAISAIGTEYEHHND